MKGKHWEHTKIVLNSNNYDGYQESPQKPSLNNTDYNHTYELNFQKENIT